MALSINLKSCLIALVHLPSFRFRWEKSWFGLSLVLLALFKLWLVHTEEMSGSATQFDALAFARSASHWYWNTSYDWLAFVRPPAYPLWLALGHAAHVPQRLAIELLLLSGCVAFVLALRRAELPRWFCLVAFAALSLQPYEFLFFDYTMADNFYAAVLPLLLAGFISMMVGPARFSMSILTGFVFAVLWNTRDESLILLAVALVWLVLWLRRARGEGGSWSGAARKIFKPAATFAITGALLILSFYTINQRTFGAFAKSDMFSPSLQRLIHALLRIKPTHDQRFVSIPMESYRRAFTLSPTFALLQPHLEGEVGEFWRAGTIRWSGIDEISTGIMHWAIRNAASRAGMDETPAKNSSFFRKAAREINQACDSGQVPTRPVLSGYLDPLTLTGWKFLPQSIGRVATAFVRPAEIGPALDDPLLTPAEKQLYDELTWRSQPRSDARTTLSWKIENWIAHYHRFLIWALFPCAVISLGLIAVFHFRTGAGNDAITLIILLLGFTIVSRGLLFAILDATAYDAATAENTRYIMPVMPLLTVTMLLSIYQAARLLKRRASSV